MDLNEKKELAVVCISRVMKIIKVFQACYSYENFKRWIQSVRNNTNFSHFVFSLRTLTLRNIEFITHLIMHCNN